MSLPDHMYGVCHVIKKPPLIFKNRFFFLLQTVRRNQCAIMSPVGNVCGFALSSESPQLIKLLTFAPGQLQECVCVFVCEHVCTCACISPQQTGSQGGH